MIMYQIAIAQANRLYAAKPPRIIPRGCFYFHGAFECAARLATVEPCGMILSCMVENFLPRVLLCQAFPRSAPCSNRNRCMIEFHSGDLCTQRRMIQGFSAPRIRKSRIFWPWPLPILNECSIPQLGRHLWLVSCDYPSKYALSASATMCACALPVRETSRSSCALSAAGRRTMHTSVQSSSGSPNAAM